MIPKSGHRFSEKIMLYEVRHCDSALLTHCRVQQTFQTECRVLESFYSRS